MRVQVVCRPGRGSDPAGGVYATTSAQITGIAAQPFAGLNPPLLPGDAVTARVSASQTAFAMTVGGGLDIRITKHLTFRPIAVDYYMTRLQNLRTDGDNNQNNIRYSGGLAFWFGGPKTKAVAHRAAPAMKTRHRRLTWSPIRSR